MKTNPSYTHLKYGIMTNLWHAFVMIAIALAIKVGAESEPSQVIHWVAVLQGGVFLAYLLREIHSQARRRYYVTLGDRIMLARKLHRDPELKLWTIIGFNVAGNIVLLQQHFGDPIQKQIQVHELFSKYTQLDPNAEEREPLTGE